MGVLSGPVSDNELTQVNFKSMKPPFKFLLLVSISRKGLTPGLVIANSVGITPPLARVSLH